MLGTIAIVAAGVLTIILGFAVFRPDSFRIQRSLIMGASPEQIFTLINDFQTWGSWSPYEKLDPTMKKSYSGPRRGPGAACAWDGNSKAGAGRMEIVSIVPNSKVTIKLDFIRPFEGHNTAEFTIEPAAGGTKVTWAMYGPQNYMCKLMSIFLNMDRLLGKEFEEGLNNLKTLTGTTRTEPLTSSAL